MVAGGSTPSRPAAATSGSPPSTGIEITEASTPSSSPAAASVRCEHVVEIDRAAELAEQAGAPVLCLGASSAAERSRTIDAIRASSSDATSRSFASVARRDLRPSAKMVTASTVAKSAAAQAMTIVVMTIGGLEVCCVPRAYCKRP